MGLKEDAEALQNSHRNYQRCDVEKAIEQLGAEDVADLTALIDENNVMATVIQDVLAQRDPPTNLSANSIRRHRNRRCKCIRDRGT